MALYFCDLEDRNGHPLFQGAPVGCQEFEIDPETTRQRWLIGRAVYCDFCIKNPYVSREHFEIILESVRFQGQTRKVWRIQRLSERGWLFLNQRPLKRFESELIESGDRVSLGWEEAKILFLLDCEDTLAPAAWQDGPWPDFSEPEIKIDLMPSGDAAEILPKLEPAIAQPQPKRLPEFAAPEEGPWYLQWAAALYNYTIKLPRWALVSVGVAGLLGSAGYGVHVMIQSGILITTEASPGPWQFAAVRDRQFFTESKRVALEDRLRQLMITLGADRASVRVYYGVDEGLLIADVHSGRSSPIPLPLWSVTLTDRGFAEIRAAFNQGNCYTRQASDLDPDSALRRGMKSTGTETIVSCPLRSSSGAQHGYVSIDSNQRIEEVSDAEKALKEAAKDVVGIMGYQ